MQKQENFLLIEGISNFVFIKQHPVSRGKRNTDVTELHITLGWHRLWSPTQTLLHSFGHFPALAGLPLAASLKLTPGPTVQIPS